MQFEVIEGMLILYQLLRRICMTYVSLYVDELPDPEKSVRLLVQPSKEELG
jgi:hypothetical protein